MDDKLHNLQFAYKIRFFPINWKINSIIGDILHNNHSYSSSIIKLSGELIKIILKLDTLLNISFSILKNDKSHKLSVFIKKSTINE